MKLVVDTNTIISGSLWRGPPAQLLAATLAGQARLFLSESISMEVWQTLQHPKFKSRLASVGETAESITSRFRSVSFQTVPVDLTPPVALRDPNDLHILACAVGAQAEAIVSGDHDLLVLHSYQGIPIITAREALRRLGLDAG